MFSLIQVSAWKSYLRRSGFLASTKTLKECGSPSGSALGESITRLEDWS